MAIPLSSKPNTEAPTVTYPFGDIRDDSGANDGTPVNTEVYGDFHQFFAALMSVAGIAYNGLRENSVNGYQYLLALAAYVRLITATEALSGTAEIATQTETNTGTDDLRIVTPLKLANAQTVVGVDSALGLRMKVVEIGDWDMDATGNKSVAHGIANYKKIRGVSVVIRDDADSVYRPLDAANILTGADVSGAIQTYDSTNINLGRTNGGLFDGTDYNSTSFNRGWVTISYVA